MIEFMIMPESVHEEEPALTGWPEHRPWVQKQRVDEHGSGKILGKL